MAMEQLTSLSDEVREGRSSVRVKEERVEQMNKVVGLWTVEGCICRRAGSLGRKCWKTFAHWLL